MHSKKLYFSLIEALTDQKIALQKYNQAEIEVVKWQRRAKLAEQKGEQKLVHLALEQEKIANVTVNELKVKLDKQTTYVDSLKHKLKAGESEFVVKHSSQRCLSTSSAIAGFDRIEEKVLQQEARANNGNRS